MTNTQTPSLSPDGQRVITAADTSLARSTATVATDHEQVEITVWDVESAKRLFSLKEHFVGIWWSPDGKRIAGKIRSKTANRDSLTNFAVQVKVWDANTGAELAQLGESLFTGGMAFSPDSRRLAISAPNTNSDTDILIRDLDSGRLLRRMKGHSAPVQQLVFSPDGKRIASAANVIGTSEAEVKLWDTATDNELLNMKCARIPIGGTSSLHFSGDGHRLLFENESLINRGSLPSLIGDGTPRATK